MGSISHIVYHVMNYHCAKFGAFTLKSTILVKFCTNLLDYITNFYFKPSHLFVLAKSILSNDMQALEASAFQPF